MAVKGFYFSFDALMGLMIMSLASSVLVVSASTNEINSDDIRFSQYSSQANDIANTMQKQEAGEFNSDISLQPSEKGLTVSELIIERYESGGDVEAVAEAYVDDYRYSSQVFIDDGGLQEIYSGSSLSNSASATFMAGSNPYRVVVVVGE